jgi:hypothetical protein
MTEEPKPRFEPSNVQSARAVGAIIGSGLGDVDSGLINHIQQDPDLAIATLEAANIKLKQRIDDKTTPTRSTEKHEKITWRAPEEPTQE